MGTEVERGACAFAVRFDRQLAELDAIVDGAVPRAHHDHVGAMATSRSGSGDRGGKSNDVALSSSKTTVTADS